MTKLYRASSDFIGDASLNVEQRSMLKVKSLCLPILANDPWVPGTNEADEIDTIVLEELGLTIKGNLITWSFNTRTPCHSSENC